MRDRAGELGCDSSYMTGIADQLEGRGLVIRTPGNDRRVNVLELTDASARWKSGVAEAANRHGPCAYQLDAAQKRTLRKLLGILLAGADGVAMPNCAAEHMTKGARR